MIPINKMSNARTHGDSNTELNSHFSTITTQIKNKDTLMKALADIGAPAKISETEDGKIEARGYKGAIIMADVVIPQRNNYDVAFVFNVDNENYELVTDMQFWQ